MHKTEEQRLCHLEEMMEDIHALLIMGQDRVPGKPEYDRAIQELLKGNSKPLALYKERGGIIPKVDPESLPARFRIRGKQQSGGGHDAPAVAVRTRGNGPKAETNYQTAAVQRGGKAISRMPTRISEAPSLQGGVCNGPACRSANLPPAAQTAGTGGDNRFGTRVFAT